MQTMKWFLVSAITAGALGLNDSASSSHGWEPETLELSARAFTYRMAGEFTLAGLPVNAPVVTIERALPLRIMKRQVTAGEYGRCVAAAVCKPNSSDPEADPNFPAVNISWEDATTYARWLSLKSGFRYRLPSDEEWVFAAGWRFHDDALPVAGSSDPSIRWLARYEKEAGLESFDRRPRRIGAFGANEYGLLDLSGNVWEWTDTCFSRQALEAGTESQAISTVNCGVRVAEGQHRAYIADFIRDPSAGGCAVGTPPSNLGFRLVREEAPASVIQWLSTLARLSEWF